eukprot:Partr_v1_DN28159_c4_g1_i11_m56116
MLQILYELPNLPASVFNGPLVGRSLSDDQVPMQLRFMESYVTAMAMGHLSSILGFDRAIGTLYITSQRIYWYSTTINKGFALDYPTIILHAISRMGTTESEHQGAIYLQLDMDTVLRHNASLFANGRDEVLEDGSVFELNLSPRYGDKGKFSLTRYCEANYYMHAVVDSIFLAMSECSALHPDDPAGGDDDEDGLISEETLLESGER